MRDCVVIGQWDCYSSGIDVDVAVEAGSLAESNQCRCGGIVDRIVATVGVAVEEKQQKRGKQEQRQRQQSDGTDKKSLSRRPSLQLSVSSVVP